jgi:hypothetical protein
LPPALEIALLIEKMGKAEGCPSREAA